MDAAVNLAKAALYLEYIAFLLRKEQDGRSQVTPTCDLKSNVNTDLLAALKALLDDSPYTSDADSCECGEDGHGNGGTCCHVMAHRAILKAEGR